MYRLLIVDDERPVVDWLVELFSTLVEPELDVYKAYSVTEALELIQRVSVDIVLSDIHMPGLSGLDLARKLNAGWADRRVIVLSGYREFDYIYQAANLGVFRYVLKTEDDEVIVSAVLDAIESIITQKQTSFRQIQAEDDRALVTYMEACAFYLTQINCTGVPTYDGSSGKFEPLKPDLPIFPVLGRQVGGESQMGDLEKWRRRRMLHLLFQDLIAPAAVSFMVPRDEKDLLFLLQPLAPGGLERPEFLIQLVESFQNSCAESFQTKLGFSFPAKPIHFKNLRTFQQGEFSVPFENASEKPGNRLLATRIEQFVSANLSGDLSLTNISKNLYYNPAYISRVFKKETNKNLIAYVRDTRIATARKLLSETNANIYEIATSCGFDSPQYFATVFRKVEGTSPQEYRNLRSR